MTQWAKKYNQLIAAGAQYVAARRTSETPGIPVAEVRYENRFSVRHQTTGEWINVCVIRRAKAPR